MVSPTQIVGKQILTGISNCCINLATCLDNLLMLMECPGAAAAGSDPGQGPQHKGSLKLRECLWCAKAGGRARELEKNHTTSMSICKSYPKKLWRGITFKQLPWGSEVFVAARGLYERRGRSSSKSKRQRKLLNEIFALKFCQVSCARLRPRCEQAGLSQPEEQQQQHRSSGLPQHSLSHTHTQSHTHTHPLTQLDCHVAWWQIPTVEPEQANTIKTTNGNKAAKSIMATEAVRDGLCVLCC